MNFSMMYGDVAVLAFYIVLTIILILFGRLIGKVLYGLYWNLDPASYRSSIPAEKCTITPGGGSTCVPKTPEEINREAQDRAEEDGRYVGAMIGFLIGGVLSIFKAYNIYVKLRDS